MSSTSHKILQNRKRMVQRIDSRCTCCDRSEEWRIAEWKTVSELKKARCFKDSPYKRLMGSLRPTANPIMRHPRPCAYANGKMLLPSYLASAPNPCLAKAPKMDAGIRSATIWMESGWKVGGFSGLERTLGGRSKASIDATSSSVGSSSSRGLARELEPMKVVGFKLINDKNGITSVFCGITSVMLPSLFLASMFPPTFVTVAGAIGLFTLLWVFLPLKKWDPRAKHCYVTGGSAGLGLALAVLLTKKGADVSIVARNEERLQKALEQLESVRQTPNQILKAYSFPLNDANSSAAAFEAASNGNGGKCPDAVFLCAGASRPGFFVEEDEASLRRGMDNGYWVQAWSALAAAKCMAHEKFPGKIVFVSSVLGYMSMIGYSSYSPAKHALRGLAETLRSELLLYLVSVHIFFPGTIYSPGYIEENKTKPKITLKIEESDGGVERGHFHISADLVGNLFRSSTRGASPHNNVFMDAIYSFIGGIGLAFWRRGVDASILGYRNEHEGYLVQRGFFKSKAYEASEQK
ncbi:hypothetical protein DXG01_000518 [Tephrocybe rancida]|nr:hypothetical protein DXG01_000518 [Tephrocybe rancida]